MASVDRRPYLTATVLNQDLLDQMADNNDFDVQMAADIETPSGFIYSSDRNKYVGSTFYAARSTFPVIKRTIGEWLSPIIEFSTLELPLSNVDGKYNDLLPGGANFDGWIGKTVSVKVGIRDAASTYFSIYKGIVTDIGGLARDRSRIIIRTRDQLDKLNQKFPRTSITSSAWPDAEDNLVNTILPVIYGDYTVDPLQEIPNPPGAPLQTASIPGFVVNGKNSGVLSGASNVRILISENANSYLDSSQVWVRRGDIWGLVPSGNVGSIVANKNDLQVSQGFTFNSGAYIYEPGDAFYFRVKGKDLTTYDDNIIWQARDILMTYGSAVSGDFNANWATYRDKASPAESALSLIKSRVWLQEPEEAVVYVLSMLEQVRMEMFVDRDLKLKLRSLHPEEFEAAPSFTLRQWDLTDNSFVPKLDDRNVWNRVKGEFAYDPVAKAQARSTGLYRNNAAITQAGKTISKDVIFPNLYVETDVVNQLKEMLRLASGYPEMIELTVTPRGILLDIGDFILIDLNMGSVVFEGVPVMIREIGYDPNGLKTTMKVWSFQMTPFPGWNPGYSGIVGGSTATITKE